MEILSKLTKLTLENGVLDDGFATLTDSQLLKLKGGGSDSTSGNNCQSHFKVEDTTLKIFLE